MSRHASIWVSEREREPGPYSWAADNQYNFISYIAFSLSFKLWGNLSDGKMMQLPLASWLRPHHHPLSFWFLCISFSSGGVGIIRRTACWWHDGFFFRPSLPLASFFCPFLSSSAWSSRALRASYNEDFDTWCMTPGINKWQECRTISKVSMARLSREIRVAFQGMASHWSASYTSRRQQHSVYVFVPFSSLSLFPSVFVFALFPVVVGCCRARRERETHPRFEGFVAPGNNIIIEREVTELPLLLF